MVENDPVERYCRQVTGLLMLGTEGQLEPALEHAQERWGLEGVARVRQNWDVARGVADRLGSAAPDITDAWELTGAQRAILAKVSAAAKAVSALERLAAMPNLPSRN